MVQVQTKTSPLEGDTASAILAQIESGSNAHLDLVSQFMTNQAASLAKADSIADPVKRKQQLDIINSNFQDLRAKAPVDKKDLAEVVAAFLKKASDLDVAFADLEKPTEQQAARLAELEAEITAAQKAREDAKSAWTFGIRDPEGDAQKVLDAAIKARDEFKIQVNKDIQQRVINAEPEQSITMMQVFGQRTLNALAEHKKIFIVESGIATKSREESYKILKAMEDRLKAVTEELNQLDGQLSPVLDKLERDQDNSQLQGDAAELRRAIEQKHNEYNAALAVKNEAAKSALEFGSMETSLIQSIGAIDTLEHATAMKNRDLPKKMSIFTKILQGGKVIDISKTLADVGDQTQMRMMERTAEAGQAATNARQEFFAAQPGRIEDRKKLRIAQDEARISTLMKDKEIFAQLQAAGIDVERMFAADRDSRAPENASAA